MAASVVTITQVTPEVTHYDITVANDTDAPNPIVVTWAAPQPIPTFVALFALTNEFIQINAVQVVGGAGFGIFAVTTFTATSCTITRPTKTFNGGVWLAGPQARLVAVRVMRYRS